MAGTAEADLFGDYESEDEGAAGGPRGDPATSASAPSVKSEKKDKKEKKKDKKEKKKDKKDKKEDKRQLSDEEPAKKRLKKVEKFFELEAADDDGQEDDEEALGDEFFDDTGAEKSSAAEMQRRTQELESLQRDIDSRGDTAGVRGFSNFLDKMEDKYKKLEEEGEPSQQSSLEKSRELPLDRKEKATVIVPDSKDPKLWMIKCFKGGFERDMSIALLTKFAAVTMQGKPCPVFSCYAADHLRGFLYIEAHREADVRSFISGIRPLGAWKIILVPTTQMPAVFQATLHERTHKAAAHPGDWVRIKRNLYKGDLAMVEEVTEIGYYCKLKPRLDYEKGNKMINTGGGHKRRPPKRWFSMQDAQLGFMVVNEETRRTNEGEFTFAVIDGETYRDGYLWKNFRKHNVIIGEDVRPQTHEIHEFKFHPSATVDSLEAPGAPAPDRDSLLMPPPSFIPPKKGLLEKDERILFIPGDIVIVKNGDARNLTGKVHRVLGNGIECVVRPMGEAAGMKDMVFMSSNLRKYFKQGDHVKVIRGETMGNTGFVVQVVEGKEAQAYGGPYCIIASDSLNNMEFKCSAANLRLSFEVAAPVDQVGEYKVGSVVRIEGRDIGIIVAIEAHTRARVLCAEGAVKDLSFPKLEPIALNAKGFGKGGAIAEWTSDKKGRKLKAESYVHTPTGVEKAPPVKAVIRYVHGSYVFMEAIEGKTGDERYIVAPGNKVELLYNIRPERKENKELTADEQIAAEREMLGANMSSGIVMASEVSFLDRPKQRLNMGEPFKIFGGTYKGLRAEFRQDLGDKVRVSLLTKPKFAVIPWAWLGKDDQALSKAKMVKSDGEVIEAPAPKTPLAEIELTPKTPLDDGDAAVVSQDEDDLPLGAITEGTKEAAPVEDIWNPMYLLEKEEKEALLQAAPNPEWDAPVKEKMDVDDSASDAPAGGSVNSSEARIKRQKRASKIPTRPAHEASDDLVSESGSHHSPHSAGFDPLEHRGIYEDATSERVRTREPWLIEGCGVTFEDDAARQAEGWIYKVYADTAHIVGKEVQLPEKAINVETDKVIPRKGDVIQPILCCKRGEQGLVFDGPKRCAMGRIQGVDEDFGLVFLRLEQDQAKLGKVGDVIQAKKAHVAYYNKGWGHLIHQIVDGAASPSGTGQPIPATPEQLRPGSPIRSSSVASSQRRAAPSDPDVNNAETPTSSKIGTAL